MDGGDISSFVTNGEWDLIGNIPTMRCAFFAQGKEYRKVFNFRHSTVFNSVFDVIEELCNPL